MVRFIWRNPTLLGVWNIDDDRIITVSQPACHNWHILWGNGVGKGLSKVLGLLLERMLLLLLLLLLLRLCCAAQYMDGRYTGWTTGTRTWSRYGWWCIAISSTWNTFVLSSGTKFGMNFGMSLFLIWTSEFTATGVTRERFFSCVSPYMGCEVIRSGETSHANSTLEGFLTRMNTNVSGELIWPAKSTIASFHWTSIRPLMNGSFTGTIRITSGFHRHQSQRSSLYKIEK